MTTREANTPAAVGVLGFALAVFYAIFVRFYHAAGGTIGMGGLVPRDLPTFQFASFVAGLIILLGGVACLMLTRPALRRVPAWVPVLGGRELPTALMATLCGVPVLVGGVYAVIHGLGGFGANLLSVLGFAEIPIPADAWLNLDSSTMSWWELFFYEPWFVTMGMCLLLSARRYALDKGVAAATARRVGFVCTALLLAGGAAFVWMIVSHNLLVL
ncbi:hypothetical protein [Saccharomonospora xinjiangensis]|uniref:DUF3995 domain-containing protein n=1 Tax=Saccharomonospora xinjiangensis XJ-54 TaxID=882086 RepID=I0V1T3_9PSEU|nr:hypothetical protein [Saccharomonospora xinjiangensis]EID54086.1 hypothetical protein SacxiDRAFT_1845 [Saccharomonospora xinjiangensis XJ-54]